MSDLNKHREKELVELVRLGNKEAFEVIFLRYYEKLCNFAWRYVRSRAISEEMVMDVFLCVWEKRKSINPVKGIRTFLYQSVKNRSLDYIDHQKVAHQYLTELAETENVYQPEEDDVSFDEKKLKEIVKEVVKELPEKTKNIYQLNRKDGLTYQEIAEVLEISPKTVEYHMSQSLDFLRMKLSAFLLVLAAFGIMEKIF